jgi:NADPH-dependent 2,4-dienoyl-CoA reductase/sulfur reductase-like enzyme
MPDVSRFDVVVVGAGPAGLHAAFAASRRTSSIAVLDQSPMPGGQIWRRDVAAGYPRDKQWLVDAVMSRATFIGGANVIDASSANGRHRLLVEQSGRSFTVETGTLILATGARELFLPFPGWTLPGVVGAGGLQALMKSGLDVRGKRIVVAGTGPLLVAVAATAVKKGADVVAVLEQASLEAMMRFGLQLAIRPFTTFEALGHLQHLGGGTLRLGTWVTSASGTGRVERITMSDGGASSHVDCDLLAVGYGLIPNTELARRLGCEVGARGIVVDGARCTSVEGIFAAGECIGVAGVDQAIQDGSLAAIMATNTSLLDSQRRRRRRRTWGAILDRTFALRPEVLALAKPDTVVCRCEDVRLRDLDSLGSARQAKLYTRAGMGPCQGRVCGAALQAMCNWPADSVRPPLQPAAISSLLGAS